jgi:hypothetical protein
MPLPSPPPLLLPMLMWMPLVGPSRLPPATLSATC